MALDKILGAVQGATGLDIKKFTDNPLFKSVVDGLGKFAEGMRGKDPLEVIKELEKKATESASGLTGDARDKAIAAGLEKVGMKPAEAEEALKKYRANPNISSADFSKSMSEWGKQAGNTASRLWASVTTTVGAAATAVTVAATAATLKPGEYIERGEDGKPVVVDTNKYAGPVSPTASSTTITATVSPATPGATPFVLVTPAEHAAAEAAERARVNTSVAGSGITAAAPAGEAFTTATAVPAVERPKARIYLDAKLMAAAETDGVPKHDISGHRRFLEAAIALSEGKPLDKFQEATLKQMESQFGAQNRDELKAMMVKPEPARVVASYDPKLNGIEYQAP
jgi:hypothetical protein